MTKFLTAIVLFFSLLSCESEKEGLQSTNNENSSLPASSGRVGEILLVMDTSHLKMELGNSLKQVFLQPYPGLPQPEMPFKLTRINYLAFKNLFKKHKTILFTIPFDDGKSSGYMDNILGADVVNKLIKSNKQIHIMENVFAKNQQMIFVFGKTQKDVSEALNKYRNVIYTKIDEREEVRLEKLLYGPGQNKSIGNKLENDFNYKLKIPKDFKLVKSKAQFTWLRLALEEYDYNIVISKMPYSAEFQFDSAYISQWRNNLGINVNSGDTSSSKILQTIYPIETNVITEPLYMVENRGLWKLKNNTMGGPFVSYVLASKDRKSIYYIEGFIAAPGKDKRELVRELEVILKTFKV